MHQFAFIPKTRVSIVHFKGDWLGLRAIQDMLVKRIIVYKSESLTLQEVLLLKEVLAQKLLTQATLLGKICCKWLSKWHQN
jgi:hypothetical protein